MGPAPAAYTAFASRFSFSLLEKPRPRLRKLAEPPCRHSWGLPAASGTLWLTAIPRCRIVRKRRNVVYEKET